MDNNNKTKAKKTSIENIFVGLEYSFVKLIKEEDLEQFCKVSGDYSPLHCSDAFAKERGFSSRVVHGALFASYISRMVGMFLPGENCLLQSLDLKFLSPCYPNNTICVLAVVDQISVAVKSVVLKITISRMDPAVVLAKGKAVVGFTDILRSGGSA